MPTRYLSQDAAGHKILLTAKETQQRLGIGPTTLNKFVRLKWLTPVRFSKRLVRYRTNEIDALIEKFMKNGGAV
jgi:predicted DNA-binding transcriptional regulator AlpA